VNPNDPPSIDSLIPSSDPFDTSTYQKMLRNDQQDLHHSRRESSEDDEDYRVMDQNIQKAEKDT
jgi:hypothetical protein